MVRPLRLDHPGAVWHVTSRGNERREIFRDDEDRRSFLDALAYTVELDRWTLHAYVLMTNHFRLLIETPEATLSKGMHRLNGTYTQRYNRRHGRVGHLYQGRFTAILVERDRHLMSLIRYIVLNPVRAGLVQRADEWDWSSYRATAGISRRPNWLRTAWILAQFGSARGARARYRAYVAEGEASPGSSPLSQVVSQIYLGSEDFLRNVERLAAQSRRNQSVPREQFRPLRPRAELIAQCVGSGHGELRRGRRKNQFARAAFAYLSRVDGLLSARVFGRQLGVRPSWGAELARKGERLFHTSPEFRSRVKEIRARIRDRQTET